MSWRTRTHGSPRQVGKPYKVRGGRVKGVARSTRYKSTPADKQYEREAYAAEIKAERDLEAHAIELDKRRQRYAAKRKYVKNTVDLEYVSVNEGVDVWRIDYDAGIARYSLDNSVVGEGGKPAKVTDGGMPIKRLRGLDSDIESYLNKQGYTNVELTVNDEFRFS